MINCSFHTYDHDLVEAGELSKLAMFLKYPAEKDQDLKYICLLNDII